MRRPAFTIIELLVTTAIVGILTALMFTSFSKEKHRNAIKASMQQLQTDLKEMQTNAQAGVQAGVSQVRGFGIHLVQNDTRYVLFADNATGAQFYQVPTGQPTDDEVLRTRELGAGVTIINAATDVEFTSPNGKAVSTSAGNETILMLKQADINTCYSVSIATNVGTISLRKLVSPCP